MIALHPALRRLRYIVVFDDDPHPVRGKSVADDAHALASRLFHAPAACPYARDSVCALRTSSRIRRALTCALPASSSRFIASAAATRNRIAPVSGMPKKQMMNTLMTVSMSFPPVPSLPPAAVPDLRRLLCIARCISP